ncbi:hypothetical protein X760_32635 [Mesorhizobium sp. LSHC422A00]|nr:hypothetical protein X762_31415 [Mesorhizobium sp. LSHC426A00]ESX45211.1 hypothetical protein X761_32665 [Mesorhizobium sp. LSHC424B00]ESX48703.1 hypothetical protein X760_32635 [Mesorhizobium sp. LSHC422A00]ESX63959.1 hypothetical protein X758_32605 [Mesorhizobium sp. LSHC416B00]
MEFVWIGNAAVKIALPVEVDHPKFSFVRF